MLLLLLSRRHRHSHASSTPHPPHPPPTAQNPGQSSGVALTKSERHHNNKVFKEAMIGIGALTIGSL